jgi:hypothetical protein
MDAVMSMQVVQTKGEHRLDVSGEGARDMGERSPRSDLCATGSDVVFVRIR